MVHKSFLTFGVLATAALATANVEILIEGHTLGPIDGQGTWQGPGTVSPIHSPRLGSTQSVRYSFSGGSMRSTAFFRLGPRPEKLKKNGIYFWNLDFMGTGHQSLVDGDFYWLRQQLPGGTLLLQMAVAAGIGVLSRGNPFIGYFPLSARFNPDGQALSISAWQPRLKDNQWYTITRVLDIKGKRSQGISIKEVASSSPAHLIHVSDDFGPIYDPIHGSYGQCDEIDRIRFGHDYYPNLSDYFYDNIQFLKAKRITGTLIFDPPGAPTTFLGDTSLVGLTLVAYPIGGGPPTQVPFNPVNKKFATGLLPGSYDAYIVGDGFLSKRLGRLEFTDTNADLDVGTLELRVGDIDGDDQIGTDDYLILNQTLDLDPSDPNFDGRADLDRDGFVTSDDYLLFSFNFDRTGDMREDGR